MKTIPLTKGKHAIVDDKDFELVSQFKWRVMERGHLSYAMRMVNIPGSKRLTLLMHRVLLDPPKDKLIDHVNGDGLDNRRENLRLATHAQNMYNRRVNSNSMSGLKGVAKMGKKWIAKMTVEGRWIYLGSFPTKELAAEAYVQGCKERHGDFFLQHRYKDNQIKK